MFQRVGEQSVRLSAGWSGTLPRSGVAVLSALSTIGLANRKRLAMETGLATTTLRSALARLIEHDLVNEVGDCYSLTTPDFVDVLDRMAIDLGVSDRPERRRAKFAAERVHHRRDLKYWRECQKYRDAKKARALRWTDRGEPYDLRTGEVLQITS